MILAPPYLEPKEGIKMNDFVNEFEGRYQAPSQAEIDRLIAEAHAMRNAAMRDALIGIWGMLRRSIGRKPVARHA